MMNCKIPYPMLELKLISILSFFKIDPNKLTCHDAIGEDEVEERLGTGGKHETD